MCPPYLRGDGPEALALRPSHTSGPWSPSLFGAPLATVSLASGYVQGGLTIDPSFKLVKYLGQVIFGQASSPRFWHKYDHFGGFGSEGTCAEIKYAFDCTRTHDAASTSLCRPYQDASRTGRCPPGRTPAPAARRSRPYADRSGRRKVLEGVRQPDRARQDTPHP